MIHPTSTCSCRADRRLQDLRKLHHKLMVIDETIVVAGSFNYTQPANDYNDENLFVLGSPLPRWRASPSTRRDPGARGHMKSRDRADHRQQQEVRALASVADRQGGLDGCPGADQVALDLERVRAREVRPGQRRQPAIRWFGPRVAFAALTAASIARPDLGAAGSSASASGSAGQEDRLDPPGLRLEHHGVADARRSAARSRCPRDTR